MIYRRTCNCQSWFLWRNFKSILKNFKENRSLGQSSLYFINAALILFSDGIWIILWKPKVKAFIWTQGGKKSEFIFARSKQRWYHYNEKFRFVPRSQIKTVFCISVYEFKVFFSTLVCLQDKAISVRELQQMLNGVLSRRKSMMRLKYFEVFFCQLFTNLVFCLIFLIHRWHASL